MSKRSERMEITSTDLLDSVRCSFEIAVSALVQAGSNLEILGFELTKLEVLAVVDDLRNAITAIDNHKSNTTLLIKETDFNDRSHEGSGLTGNQQLPVDLSSIGRLKATCPIFEDGHGDHGY